MNRDDIERMAVEAGGGTPEWDGIWELNGDALERFVALVAAEKEQQMIRDGWRQCAKGQRTTQYCGLLDAAVKAEREACAKACEARKIIDSEYEYDRHYNQGAEHCAFAIRARGET